MPAYGVLLFMFFVFCTGCIGLGYYYHRQEGGWVCLVTIIGFMHSCAFNQIFFGLFSFVFFFSGLVTPKTGISSFLFSSFCG